MKFVKLHRAIKLDGISDELFVPIERVALVYRFPMCDKTTGKTTVCVTHVNLLGGEFKPLRVSETPEEVVALIEEKTK